DDEGIQQHRVLVFHHVTQRCQYTAFQVFSCHPPVSLLRAGGLCLSRPMELYAQTALSRLPMTGIRQFSDQRQTTSTQRILRLRRGMSQLLAQSATTVFHLHTQAATALGRTTHLEQDPHITFSQAGQTGTTRLVVASKTFGLAREA